MDYDNYNIKDHISFINFEYLASAELKAGAYRDWGLFYKHRHLYQLAADSFSESLEHDATGYQSLLERSLCHLALGDVNAALASIERCLDLRDRPIAQQHRNNCVYEQNRFEAALSLYSTSSHQYPRSAAMRNGADMVQLTIEHTVDQRRVGNCLLNMRADIARYDEHRQILDQLADGETGADGEQRQRPLWKVLRDRGECDVVSVLIRPAPYVPLIQLLRTERKRSNKDVMYMGRQTALDIAFMMRLQHDSRLFLKHTIASNATMRTAIEKGLHGVNTMERRLWCRKPLYAMRYAKQPTGGRPTMATIAAELGLNRIQYQTRRDVFAQLEEIRRLADNDQLDAVRARVDHVIAKYYSTKTRRVFPRKFEFMNEVINEVALVYLRQCVLVPACVMDLEPAAHRLNSLLQIVGERKSDETMTTPTNPKKKKKAGGGDGSAEFGDKSAFVDPGEPDVAYYTYKRRVNEVELRLQRSRYPIERCYLCYELVMSHMNERKPDETRLQAGRLVTQAIECGNRVWEFIGLLLGARVEVDVGQLQAAGMRLQRMDELAPNFDEDVHKFVKVALVLHAEQLAAREQQKQLQLQQAAAR